MQLNAILYYHSGGENSNKLITVDNIFNVLLTKH